MWTRSIETFSEATASCHRIETFLQLTEQLEQNTSDPSVQKLDVCLNIFHITLCNV